MRRLIFTMALLAGCSAGEETTVRIDLGDVWQRSAQTDTTNLTELFTMAELTVTGAGMSPIVQSIDLTDPAFEVDVPSGSARTFAFEGYNEGDPDHLTQYWGYTREDLPAGGEIEITIPIARAGRLPGTLVLRDQPSVTPPPVELSFDYGYDPIEELPGPFVFDAVNGAFSLPLPTGPVEEPFREYVVTVGPFSVAGVRYELLEEDGYVWINGQGLNSPQQLFLEPICEVGRDIECCSSVDCDGAVCNLETHICEGTCEVGVGGVECCGDGDCTSLPGGYCNLDTNQCETASVLVQVFDPDGAPHTTALDVLVHDSSGTYVRETSTDLGEAVVEVSYGYMVSVLSEYVDDYANHDVYTAAGVNPGDTVRYMLPGYVNTNNIQEGDIAVSVSPSPPAGSMTQYVSIPGSGSYNQVPAGKPYSTNLWTWNLGDDGDLDVLGWARDGNSFLLGFAVHLGITPQTGGTLTLGNWDESPISLDFTFANAPGKPGMFIRTYRDGVEYRHDQYVDPYSPSDSFLVPAGFFDRIDAVTYVDNFPGEQRLFRRFLNDVWTNPVQTDFETDMLPQIDNTTTPPDFDVTTVPARPAVIWATAANPADYDATLIQVSIDGGMDKLNWWVVAPPAIVSPYSMPDLSSVSSTGFHPDDARYLDGWVSGEIRIFDSDAYLNFPQYLDARGVRGLFLDDWPEQDFEIRWSSGTFGG